MMKLMLKLPESRSGNDNEFTLNGSIWVAFETKQVQVAPDPKRIKRSHKALYSKIWINLIIIPNVL